MASSAPHVAGPVRPDRNASGSMPHFFLIRPLEIIDMSTLWI